MAIILEFNSGLGDLYVKGNTDNYDLSLVF